MYKFSYFIFFLLFLNHLTTNSQTINGKIKSLNNAIPFASILIEGSNKKTKTDKNGFFQIQDVPLGDKYIIVSTNEISKQYFLINVKKGVNNITCNLTPPSYNLDQVVVTGTKTLKKKNRFTCNCQHIK